MIEFNCVCKQYKFSLPLEMAGGLIQCPTCRRLVDVPNLGELAHIDEDGGYKFEGESTSKKLDAKVATRAFSTARVDEYGEEIDLRTSFEEIQRVRVPNTPGTLDGVKPIPPKYDPITGELIRPLPIKNDTPQRVLPVHPESDEPIDAVPIPVQKLSYSVVPPANMSLGGAFIALLQPANIVVMGFILLMHLFLQLSAMTASVFFFAFVAPLALVLGLIGHYGNVIDEVGPSGRDELPAPLRNVSFGEDMWRPFCQLSFALFLAFLPLWISEDVAMPLGVRQIVQIICLVFGVIVAPAMVLTSVTSGTYLNLRPDRVAGSIAVCFSPYVFTIITFAGAGFLYVFALDIIAQSTLSLFHGKSIAVGMTQVGLGYTVLAAAIYVAHAFCWQLGLIYRTYHDRFPWILQRHVPVRMAERTRSLPGRSHPGHLPPMNAAGKFE
jgi:hypothetical protein